MMRVNSNGLPTREKKIRKLSFPDESGKGNNLVDLYHSKSQPHIETTEVDFSLKRKLFGSLDLPYLIF